MSTDDEQIQSSFEPASSTMSLDALQRVAYAASDTMTVDIATAGDRDVCTSHRESPRSILSSWRIGTAPRSNRPDTAPLHRRAD